MSTSRNVLVAVAGIFLFVVVAGAVYLEILASSRSSDLVWAVSSSVSAGDQLTPSNVHQVRVPRTGDTWNYYTGDLLHGDHRAAHDMAAGTMLFADDVLVQEMALVTLSLHNPPPLAHGEHVDIYTQVNGRTFIVGRGLVVDTISGSNCSVWVSAADEPSWITLQASNLSVYAARSSGVGVPQSTNGQAVSDAVAALGGGVSGLPPGSTVRPGVSPTPR